MTALLLAWNSSAQVVINEIAASNGSTVENGGKFPDWVEFYNTSLVTADMLGSSITFSNVDGTNTFNFSSHSFIDPQKFLVVWFDSDTNAPGLHTLYNLPRTTGGGLTLVRSDATVHNVKFGIQITDLTIGLVPDGDISKMRLTVPTPQLANVAQDTALPGGLKINELMATNAPNTGTDKNNDDWLEIYNPDPLPVALGGLILSDSATNSLGSKVIVPLSFISGSEVPDPVNGGFLRFWCDGSPKKGADHLNFKLSSSNGDTNYILSSNGGQVSVIDRVGYGPCTTCWDQSLGRLPDGSDNIIRFARDKDTPGASNFQPLTNVVINEILTHTDPPLEDAIEIYNPTGSDVDMSYWWLSNRKEDPKKFQIPAGTIITAACFKVFYEMVGATGGFDTSGTGNSPDFRLNAAKGDSVYLFTADPSGTLTGYRRGVDFGAANHGVSFGRYITSTGDPDITAMSHLSFGQDNPSSVQQFRMGAGLPNPYPAVGPVVINEIMYKPPNIITNDGSLYVTNDNSLDEYIELHNISTTNVPLYLTQISNDLAGHSFLFTNGWKLDDAVTYTFPGQLTLAPNGFLLAVNFDPVTNTTQLAAFRSKFSVPPSFTNIFGPYGGKLKNSSASIKLYAPDNVQETNRPDAGLVPLVLIDKVNYADSSPWPTAADGHGSSLQRRHRAEYGNDPINWGVLAPSPGRTNNFTNAVSNAAVGKFHSEDGLDYIDVSFTARQGQPYTVIYQNDLMPGGLWLPLTNIVSPSNGPAHAYDPPAFNSRFYRVKTQTSP